MLKENAAVFRRLLIIIDLAIVAGSFYAAYVWRNSIESLYPFDFYILPLVYMLAIWGVCLHMSGIYTSFRLKRSWEIFYLVYQSAYISFLLFAGLCYILRITDLSRTLVIMAFVIAMVILSVEKFILIKVFRRLRKKGLNYRQVLVVGTGPRAQRLIKSLDENKELGLKLVGVLDHEKTHVGEILFNHPVIGTLQDLPKITRELVVDQVFFVVPRGALDQIEEAILYLEKLGVRVDIAVDHFNVALSRAKQSEFFGIPFLSFETTPSRLLPLLTKRAIDVVVSLLALLALSPLFLITAALIKLTSPGGPVFFNQKRVSMNGRIFSLFKFRTMVPDAEAKLKELQHLNEMKGPVFKIERDPRITPLGVILRKTSIDELPQLWNVLKGDMSLVGPRPPLPSEVEKYDDWQRRRLSMRPGITCLWQVGGRNKITDFNEWARLDLEYIDNWSLWLDIKILFKTVPVVLFGIGAK